jgi:hypothetical protein
LPLWTSTVIVVLVEMALTTLGAIGLTLLFGDAGAELEEKRALSPWGLNASAGE